MTFRLTDQSSTNGNEIFDGCWRHLDWDTAKGHKWKSIDRKKEPSARDRLVSWFHVMDIRRWILIVHAVFDGRSGPHTEIRETKREKKKKKCRSAMIFNKRSLNFILVFSYTKKIFFFVFFTELWLLPLKKTFHSTFCCCCCCLLPLWDKVRFESIYVVFGETLKIIKKNVVYPYSQTRCKKLFRQYTKASTSIRPTMIGGRRMRPEPVTCDSFTMLPNANNARKKAKRFIQNTSLGVLMANSFRRLNFLFEERRVS